MRKILINGTHGGFGLSNAAFARWVAEKDREGFMADYLIPRDDPLLIRIVEEIGLNNAGTRYCYMKIVEIPDDVKWHIAEYDGKEWVAEDHRTWGEDA